MAQDQITKLKSTKTFEFLKERFQYIGALWVGMWLVAWGVPALVAYLSGGDANSARPLPFKDYLDYKLAVAILVGLVGLAGVMSITLILTKEIDGQSSRMRDFLTKVADELSSACTHLFCGTFLMLSLQHEWSTRAALNATLFLLGGVLFFRRSVGGLLQAEVHGSGKLANKDD